MRTIGEAMRQCRLSRGVSLQDLSEAAGVSDKTIRNAEGGRHYPGILVVVSCAEALGVSLDEYVGIKDRRKDG